MNIRAILTAKYPGNSWSLNGDDYTGLVWSENNPDSKPTKNTLEAAWPQVEYEGQYNATQHARQQAYRETSDPIFFEYQRGDATEAEWLAAVQAVKDAHPYPEPV